MSSANTKYSDFKSNFDFHPFTQDLALDTDETAVKASIRHIVFTGKYERFHNAKFGAGVPQRLFENIGIRTEYDISTRTEEAIRFFEPRVTNVQVHVNAAEDDNSVFVYVVFTTINISTPITLNLILKRVR